jgi:hypothetical protein
MSKGKGGGPAKKTGRNDNRPNGKAWKKRPKVWDPEKGKLVTGPSRG